MLTSDQIAALRDKASELTDPVLEFLLEDITRRISEAGKLTSTAAYQIWRAQNLGVSQGEIKKELKRRLKITESRMRQLLTAGADAGYDYDISRFPHVEAVPFAENTALQQILQSAMQVAGEELENLTQTIGMVDPYGNPMPLRDVYRSCCDYAFKLTTTGAADYSTAIRRATRNLADKGLRVIDYESGVHTGMEAAVRRSVMGALGLMQEQISQQNHDDFGCDGWEISAHAASAPDHEPIQGKQYSDAAYTSLNNSLLRRIGTLNCGHSAFPIIMGVTPPQYSEEELDKLRSDNEKGVTVDGKHYTQYEATQLQRKIERAMRRQKNRILVDETADDKDKLLTDQIKLQRLRQEYSRVSDAAGLRTQHERAEVAGFDWKKAREAERAFEKTVKKPTRTENAAIDTASSDLENKATHFVGRLDIEKFKGVSKDIATEEVIITDERIKHIEDHHPGDYELIAPHLQEAIYFPDYILEDKPNTGLILKQIEEGNMRIQVIVRVKTSTDPSEYKNSIISAWKIGKKRWDSYVRKRKILYKTD